MSNTTTSKNKKQNVHTRKLKDISKVDIAAVEDKLVQARISLLIQQPFFGNMVTRLPLVRAEEWLDTAATDGRFFYYNPAFIDSLTNKQVEFLFGHEVLHNVFEHLLRRDSRDAELWNVSADYCVNQILIDNNIGKIIPDCLYDSQYKEWSAEQVYEHLNNTLGTNGKSYEQALQDLIDKMVDSHCAGNLPGDDDDESEGNSEGKSRMPFLSDAERQKIRDEIREAMLNAAQQSAGIMPAGVKRLVNQLTQPKMNWRDILRQQVQSCISSDYSYLRPNRKTMQQGIVLPGVIKGETISVVIALDASGSISQADATDFLTEIDGIVSQYDDYNIRVWSFDTQVYNDQTFSLEGGEGISEYQIKGGGGTSFDVNWTYMKENGIEPKIFVMFTDGYTGDGWGDADYCESIFIVKHNQSAVAPHGITVTYEEL